MVTIELYGVPRLHAGTSQVEVPAGSLTEVICALLDAAPGLFPGVISEDGLSEHVMLVHDGTFIHPDPALPIADGSVLLLISAQAGG